MKNLVVILDPAHGLNVSGKCSPDGTHRECLWSRERVKRLTHVLLHLGYDVYVTTTSDDEPGLTKRKNFATQIKNGSKKLLISLHNNAAGDGKTWMTARGVEVWTSPGVTDSDVCAEYLLKQFKKDFPNFKLRVNRDKYLERDKESKFTVLMGGGYMGVLVEWLFQDNKDDVALLTDYECNRKFESSIVAAIENINDYFDRINGA